MVTIHDIAKKSGYDAATVSRALSGKQNVRVKTREHIESIAKEMGYVPNILAKSLKVQKSWNIGIIMNLSGDLGLKHYLFADVLDSFAKTVQNEGYDITILKNHTENFDYLEHSRGKRYDGIFVICGDFNKQSLVDLIHSEIPVVAIDYTGDNIDELGVNCITSNNREMMYLLTCEVLDKGHKDVTFITGEDVFITRERKKGFIKALQEYNIELNENQIIEGNYYNFEKTKDVITEILNREKIPTAIILPDDYCAISAHKTLTKKGYKIPRDISIIGFDGIELAKMLTPSIMTVKQDAEKMGTASARRLISLINKEEIVGTAIQLVPAKIQKGGSLSNPKDLSAK